MNNDVPVELLPEEPVAPFWLEDIEDYLELLHGDDVSLLLKHPRIKNRLCAYIPDNPKKCPGCQTVYHVTKKGGEDTCPFCHATLNFSIV